MKADPAEQLLEKIKSDIPIEKSMALALINALNYRAALELPEDDDNSLMFERFKIGRGRRVAMVGYFGPLVRNFEKNGVSWRFWILPEDSATRKNSIKS